VPWRGNPEKTFLIDRLQLIDQTSRVVWKFPSRPTHSSAPPGFRPQYGSTLDDVRDGAPKDPLAGIHREPAELRIEFQGVPKTCCGTSFELSRRRRWLLSDDGRECKY